jgi:hypothetical protein
VGQNCEKLSSNAAKCSRTGFSFRPFPASNGLKELSLLFGKIRENATILIARKSTYSFAMKLFLTVIVLVCSAWSMPLDQQQTAPASQSPASQSPPSQPKASPQASGSSAATPAPTTTSSTASPTASSALTKSPSTPDDAGTRKAKSIIEQGIEALGGQAYLNIRDREQQGRGYVLHHGRPSGSGTVFWAFSEFPDKERVELTKERDIAEVYFGDKGYEITYKGVHPVEEKDLIDYLRQRRFSLDTILRTWINDPSVVILYEGYALAAPGHPSDKVTLINSKNEGVSLFFDTDTHLPIKKSFEWRDPIDRQKNLEEEIYENYRPIPGGVMAPYNITRYFNGDMSRQRFFNSVTVNQGLDEAMFNPKSGYDPNKPAKKH